MLTLALLGETQVPLTELFGDSVVLTIRLFFVFCLIMVELLESLSPKNVIHAGHIMARLTIYFILLYVIHD